MSFKERIIRLAKILAGSFIVLVAGTSAYNAITADPIKIQQLNDAVDLLADGFQIIQEAIPVLIAAL